VSEHVGTVRIRGDKSMTLVDVKTDDGTDPNGHSFGLPIRGNVGNIGNLSLRYRDCGGLIVPVVGSSDMLDQLQARAIFSLISDKPAS
jgi:hypothetical protein